MSDPVFKLVRVRNGKRVSWVAGGQFLANDPSPDNPQIVYRIGEWAEAHPSTIGIFVFATSSAAIRWAQSSQPVVEVYSAEWEPSPFDRETIYYIPHGVSTLHEFQDFGLNASFSLRRSGGMLHQISGGIVEMLGSTRLAQRVKLLEKVW